MKIMLDSLNSIFSERGTENSADLRCGQWIWSETCIADATRVCTQRHINKSTQNLSRND